MDNISVKDRLSRQSPDLLYHLCSYFHPTNLLQIHQISKVFNKIISEKVSITMEIRNLEAGLRLIKMFNKVQFRVSTNCYTDFTGVEQIALRITKLLVTFSNKVTDDILSKMVNLTYLRIWHNSTITDEGIKNLVKLRVLDLRVKNKITGKTFNSLVSLTTLYTSYVIIPFENIMLLEHIKLVYTPYLLEMTPVVKKWLVDKGVNYKQGYRISFR